MDLKELIKKRDELLSKVKDAKDGAELDALEMELRKLDMLIRAANRTPEPTPEPEPDPSLRTDGEVPETRQLSGVIKGAPAKRTDTDEDKDLTYRKAFMQFVIRKTPIPAELRADQVTTTTDTSAAVPTHLINRIIEEQQTFGNILPLITRTSYQGGVQIPKSSVRPTATWVAEGSGSDKQKKTVNEYIEFKYYKLSCRIAITLETSVVTLSIFEDTFVRQVSEAMQITLERAVLNGTGSGQPKGILTETVKSGQKITTSNGLSYKLLTNAEAALPSAYENGTVWCMTKKTFWAIVGLTDANGHPIARVNQGFNGKPDYQILGRPVILTDFMDSYSDDLAANKVFAFLFRFRDYILNTNMDVKIKQWEDNDTDDQCMKAVMLTDGRVVDTGSLVTLSKAASA